MISTTDFNARFTAAFGSTPAVTICSPGRVNLIGEHTDYSFLPVLPIAIDRNLLVGAAKSPVPGVTAESLTFPGRIQVDGHARPSSGGWARYVAAAIAELQLPESAEGINLLIDGDLPPASGLSSSSALTIGVLAAINELLSLGHDREQIARLASRAERRLGMESGDMDQQVISFAEAGHALRIDFDPTIRRSVAVPAGWHFIIANSGESAAKSDEHQDAYNARVIGARMASALLAEMLGTNPDENLHLGDIASADVVDLLAEELPGKAMIKDVARTTGVQAARLAELSHRQFETQVSIPVRGPALHILSEAQRVDQFEQAMLSGDGGSAGTILTESHGSLRENMACSTQRLDRLCKAMRDAGAWGARLTGAGFGGYALALCAEDRVDPVLAAATEAYGGPALEVSASAGWRVL